MSGRYVIYKGSSTGHCCFEATVMDSTKPTIIDGERREDSGGKRYWPVCECLDMEDALRVAEALNAMEDVPSRR